MTTQLQTPLRIEFFGELRVEIAGRQITAELPWQPPLSDAPAGEVRRHTCGTA